MFDFITAAGSAAAEAAMPRNITRERDPQTGMVYRGAEDLIHIADGQRAQYGRDVAAFLSSQMRRADWARRLLAGETDAEAARLSAGLPLCPGCYMVAMFDACLTLARESGQPVEEMARTMRDAFAALALDPSAAAAESIAVKLDEGEAIVPARVLEVA